MDAISYKDDYGDKKVLTCLAATPSCVVAGYYVWCWSHMEFVYVKDWVVLST